jgi:hypothetical protein
MNCIFCSANGPGPEIGVNLRLRCSQVTKHRLSQLTEITWADPLRGIIHLEKNSTVIGVL